MNCKISLRYFSNFILFGRNIKHKQYEIKLIVTCLMSRTCLINAICYLEFSKRQRSKEFMVKYLYCNTLDWTGTALWWHKLEPASDMAHEQACYTFSATSFTTRHCFFQSNKNLSSISLQPGLWTWLLLLLLNIWVSTLLTHPLLNVESQGNTWRWGWESGFRHWCLKFHTWGVCLRVCANDWPWCSRVQTCAGEQERRGATCDCLFGLERRCRHCIVLVLEDSSWFLDHNKKSSVFQEGSHINFSTGFCEAHQLCFYLGQTEIKSKGLVQR